MVPGAIFAPRWDDGIGPRRFSDLGPLLVQRPGNDLGQLVQVASHQGVHVEAVRSQLVDHILDEVTWSRKEKGSPVTSKERAE